MTRVIGSAVALFFALGFASPLQAAGPVKLVAAENFYGGIAQQIGGAQVEVVSVMNNPDQDPHLFETSPAVARQLAAAQIVIYNGADYDPWMPKLLAAAPTPGRIVIVAADLVHKKAGDNPHLWYDPATMPAVAKALAAALGKADPAHAAEYQARLATFLASLKPLDDKIGAVRKKYAGAAVTASEPVFGYMAAALGLQMRNEKFQLSIMNDTEPSASDVAAFERDLKEHKVRVMFYNKQASDKIVQHLVDDCARGQDAGGRRDRDPAARHDVPGLDAGRAQRHRKSAGRAEFVTVVELDHATITLGDRTVLADASFAIGAGEFIGVLGPNGAGKTTLMRAILGLLPPSAGRVRVFGHEPAARRSGHRLSAASAHRAARFARARARFHRLFAATASAGACPR